jgi:hypothetical protein
MGARDQPELLPPFSGRNVLCPKCGNTVGATWHLICRWKGFPCHRVRLHFEHMCRACSYCGYGWIEAIRDAGEDATVRQLTSRRTDR